MTDQRNDPFAKLDGEGRCLEDGSFPGEIGTTAKETDPAPPEAHERRRCNPTKRWALVGWIVGAAMLISLIVVLISAFVIKPNRNGGNNNNTTASADPRNAVANLPSAITMDTVNLSTAAPSSNAPTLHPTAMLTRTVSEEPTMHPTGAPSVLTPDTSDYTIGVYYYPWHGSNFHNRQYLRGDLQPPQLPALGEYDDTDPAVIAQHLQWSREANVNLWVASWWGPKSREDSTLLNVILPHEDLPGTRVALFYETTSRIKKSANYSTTNVYSDVAYMAKAYFHDPNYMRIDGRPVLFVYLTRVLSRVGKLGDTTALMRQAAMENGGHDLYIMGDQVFNEAPEDGNTYEPFGSLDGVTNYDIYGNLRRPDGYAGIERLTDLANRNKEWRDQTRAHGDCAFVPGVAPGYNDRSVRDGNTALSRKLDEDEPEGSLFRVSLEMALDLTEESTGKMLMITSWNEWHEDTQIEPVVGRGQQTDNPWNLTCYSETCDKALTYDAYGMLYLDILRDVTSLRA